MFSPIAVTAAAAAAAAAVSNSHQLGASSSSPTTTAMMAEQYQQQLARFQQLFLRSQLPSMTPQGQPMDKSCGLEVRH